MKGSCKLCGAVIETDPDPLMDEDHEKRERTAFFNRVAFHIDPKNKVCRPNNQKLVLARFVALVQDNGWFQRWRLLACLNDLDAYSLSKQEEWRAYLHTITSTDVLDRIATSATDSTNPPPTDQPNVSGNPVPVDTLQNTGSSAQVTAGLEQPSLQL